MGPSTGRRALPRASIVIVAVLYLVLRGVVVRDEMFGQGMGCDVTWHYFSVSAADPHVRKSANTVETVARLVSSHTSCITTAIIVVRSSLSYIKREERNIIVHSVQQETTNGMF